MLRNYWKTALRNLTRHKLFSLINLAGLSVGLAGCLLIGIYIAGELSYDRFHRNADRLVRVTTEYSVNGVRYDDGNCGSMAGPRLAAAFPQIEGYVRILHFEPYAVQYGEKAFVEPRLMFADSTFFTLFTFPLVEGDPRTALDGPHKLVITRSVARKYFGNEEALGKIMRVGGTTDYVVSGVAIDPPDNSQIHWDFMASYASLSNANAPNWWINVYTTYFLLQDPRQIPDLEKGIAAYMRRQPDRNQAPKDYLTFHLEPMTRVHLHSRLPGIEPNGNITYIYILGAIALLILCIASVNYTNLATAQAARRIPEIGIRKVLGSGRWQLFRQFIGESLLLNGLALLLAAFLVTAFLPTFNELVERSLTMGMFGRPGAIVAIVVLYLGISVASGVYPALILSGLKVISILKAGFSFTGRSGALRRSLIVFQFLVSVFLMISTVIIFQQLSYIQHKNLGYDKSHVVVLPVDGLMRGHFQAIKESLQRVPGVLNVTCGTEEPFDIHWDDEIRKGGAVSSTPLFVRAAPTDVDFVHTMGLHLIAGSDFDQADWKQANAANDPDPHTTFLLNESLVKALGWKPEEAIGKILYRSNQKGIVKGVLRDFYFSSLHEPISPLVIFLDSQYVHIYRAFVKISGNDVPATLHDLEAAWKERVPHRPFQYQFMDDNYRAFYHTESQTARIFTVFSCLAILLACLGLFALAAYTAVQRAREISIRKVLGAGVLQVMRLVAGDLFRQVALACLIAFPLAWLFMERWLQHFAYRISIDWRVFLAAGIATALIAMGSIAFQAIKAATANPVKTLRSE